MSVLSLETIITDTRILRNMLNDLNATLKKEIYAVVGKSEQGIDFFLSLLK